ncbi:Zinc finger and SCAN domain-containing protein 20 [Bagarius yarrelli]|uniref:Zinc finger and SCAN domain-containing protein 20 n=1 Tax=Bagarius yarrelli TaxID=175774 RepID=A0A556U0Y4_BAGYA|nr:Zinc finger and SCAN domain-containing protein 20 [Bagarius yarrelli]
MEMSKAERLNERVSELLAAAVQRVLEAVRDTVQEYEEKSTRTQRENERLRRRVQELQEQLDRDTAVSHITAQLTVSPSPTSARQKKASPGGQSNPLASKDKTSFKEEPHNDSQSAVFPAEIKTELEHSDYPGAEEPVLEPVLQNTYYPCEHLQFQASQNEPDFPVVPPCNNNNNITNTTAETLDTFVEHFPFEEERCCCLLLLIYRSSNASKLERLNCRVVKLLTAAVQEVMEAVRETVSEYQEKTSRTQRENEKLRLKLQDTLKELEKEREVSRLAAVSLSINRPSVESPQTADTQHVFCLNQDSVVKADAEPEAVCDLQVAFTLPDTPRTEQVNTSDLYCNSKETQRSTCASGASLCMDIKTEPVASECSQQQEQQIPQVVVSMVEDLNEQSIRQDNISSSLYIQSNLSALGRCVGNRWSAVSSLQTQRHSPRDEEHHVCRVCGKTFSRVGNLRIHQRCHTGEKPYRCLVCGRCFSQAGDLKKHKRVHTGEKPYCCVQCGKRFSRGENLKRHQKIHMGDRYRRQTLWKDNHGLAI